MLLPGGAGSGQAGAPPNTGGSSFGGAAGTEGEADAGTGGLAGEGNYVCPLPPLLPAEAPELGGIRSIEAGDLHSCALRANGFGVTCWGAGTSGQLGDGYEADSSIPVLVSGVTDLVAIAAGGAHTCALLSDASVACCVRDESGYN